MVARTRLSRMPSVRDIRITMRNVTRKSAAPRNMVRRRAARRFWMAMDNAIMTSSLLALHGDDGLDARGQARGIQRGRNTHDGGGDQPLHEVERAHRREQTRPRKQKRQEVVAGGDAYV